jgi:hypothetical protein
LLAKPSCVTYRRDLLNERGDYVDWLACGIQHNWDFFDLVSVVKVLTRTNAGAKVESNEIAFQFSLYSGKSRDPKQPETRKEVPLNEEFGRHSAAMAGSQTSRGQ